MNALFSIYGSLQNWLKLLKHQGKNTILEKSWCSKSGGDMRLSPTAGGKHVREEDPVNGKEVIGQPQGHRRCAGLAMGAKKSIRG
jgi:hypothetical protein